MLSWINQHRKRHIIYHYTKMILYKCMGKWSLFQQALQQSNSHVNFESKSHRWHDRCSFQYNIPIYPPLDTCQAEMHQLNSFDELGVWIWNHPWLEIMARLRHRNSILIVRKTFLLQTCCPKSNDRILGTKYCSNISLAYHLIRVWRLHWNILQF